MMCNSKILNLFSLYRFIVTPIFQINDELNNTSLDKTNLSIDHLFVILGYYVVIPTRITLLNY